MPARVNKIRHDEKLAEGELSMENEPVFDQEQLAMARICQEVESFIDLSQRRRILEYAMDKTVHHIPMREENASPS